MPKIKTEKKFRKHKDDANIKQGIKFNTTLGQHILKNPLIVTSIVDKVNKFNNIYYFLLD